MKEQTSLTISKTSPVDLAYGLRFQGLERTRTISNATDSESLSIYFEPWKSSDSETRKTTTFQYSFTALPEIVYQGDAAQIGLEGLAAWTHGNTSTLPVYFSGILLPQGTEIVDLQIDLGHRVSLAKDITLPLPPEVRPVSMWTDETPSLTSKNSPLSGTLTGVAGNMSGTSLTMPPSAVTYSTYRMAGYDTALLRIFPVGYDAQSGELSFYPDMKVTISVEPSQAGPSPYLRATPEDRQWIANFVENDAELGHYSLAIANSLPTDDRLPRGGPFDYVIVTSSDLADEFQTLIAHKASRGLRATIVTTEYIYSHFSGDETGDESDRLRDFVQAAVAEWGTRWLLLGGDVEHVPYRSVYAPGSGFDGMIPTDMYYACIDGTWNSDGDDHWGESNDGLWGSEIDLMPDLAVGRAPVSTTTEAQNFIRKVIQYESNPHPNANHAVFLGEQLDNYTWGSQVKEAVWNEEFPTHWWTLTARDERYGYWSSSDFINDLNRSPHIVNHLGHAGAYYNAKLFNSDVDALTNRFPFFIYSMGCDSGAFDMSDAIAERYLASGHGAVGAIMNSRSGWYYVGGGMGLSALYDKEFWNAVFDENILSMGDANNDSKIDNIGYVGGTEDVYRWLHLGITLFGDPQTQFNFQPPPPAEIHGSKWYDLDSNGIWNPGEPGLAGWTIYLDQNQNNRLDPGERSTVTDAWGNYRFIDLAPGSYTIAEVLQPNWVQTSPIRNSYHWTDSNRSNLRFNWIDISQVGTGLMLTDDSFTEVTLPFGFSFYGQTYNSVNISSNGFLSFGDDAYRYWNGPLPEVDLPNNLIAPFWDDLNPSTGGQIYYHADVNSGRFIVQYESVPHYYNEGAYTFQVILNANGNILYQYNSLNGVLNSATIGLENATGTDGVQVAYDEPYAQDGLAVLFTPITVPTSHTVTLERGDRLVGLNFGNSRQLREIIGTEGNDWLNGTGASERIEGRGGNDTINSNGGSDVLLGGDGHDRISGSRDIDWIDGGNGNDTIYGNGGHDTLIGNMGNDTIYGGSEADSILGGAGNDLIYANGGGDWIDGGLGDDTIWLGGTASVVLETGIGFDTIKNFQLGSTTFKVSDLNTLSFADSSSGAQIFQSGDLLAVVSWQSASTFRNNVNRIFVV